MRSSFEVMLNLALKGVYIARVSGEDFARPGVNSINTAKRDLNGCKNILSVNKRGLGK